MTTQNFSNTFDTLLASYSTQAQFGEEASKAEIALDEYEKSVFLTQAQDIILKSYFDRTLNNQGQGFDDSTRRQIDFSSLIKIAELNRVDGESALFDDRGILFTLPKNDKGYTDVLFILNEKLSITKDGASKDYVIVPISYKEYDREMSKPYAQPLKKQAWRLFQNMNTGFDVDSELIPIWDVADAVKKGTADAIYKIRYVKRPRPIVLTNLDGLDIEGEYDTSECELNPILHMDILNKAVELAIASRVGRAARSTDKEEQESRRNR